MQLSFTATESTSFTFQLEPPISEEASTSAWGVSVKASPSSTSIKPNAERLHFSITINQHPRPRSIRQKIREKFDNMFPMFPRHEQVIPQALLPQEPPKAPSQVPPPAPPGGLHIFSMNQQAGPQALPPQELPGGYLPCEFPNSPPMFELSALRDHPLVGEYGRSPVAPAATFDSSYSLLDSETAATERFTHPQGESSSIYQHDGAYYDTPSRDHSFPPNIPTNFTPSPSCRNQYGEEDVISPVSTKYESAIHYPTPPTASPPTYSMPVSRTDYFQHGTQGLHHSRSPEPFTHVDPKASSVRIAYETGQRPSYGSAHIPKQISHWEHRNTENGPFTAGTVTTPMRHNTTASFGSEGAPPSYQEDLAEFYHDEAEPSHHTDGQINAVLSKGRKRRSVIAQGISKFLPLSCLHCQSKFNGKYRQGNLLRHIRNMHSKIAKDDVSRLCRFCDKEFKRADATRKHQWDKHGDPDCRPEKRGVEKTQKRMAVAIGGKRQLDG